MAEKEKITSSSHEKETDVEQFGALAHERHEAIRVQLEQKERHHKRVEEEEAALEQATELAKEAGEKSEAHKEPAQIERRKGAPSKRQREQAFNAKMDEVRSEMDPASRLLSKLIHAKPIENVSDFVGSTIARPNAMLSGSIVAFISVTLLYFVAKHYGFHLSGFETVGAFILGWIIGVLYDYFSVMVRGRKR